MRVATSLLCLAGAVAAGTGLLAQNAAPPAGAPKYAFSEPGISPDGREIAFASGGDIWAVPAGGGDARLLVADAANDRRPLFSPDGRASRSSRRAPAAATSTS